MLPRTSRRVAVALGALLAVAAEPSFEADLLPVFKANCVHCHGPQQKKADLDLSTAAGLLQGGESGLVVVEGKPDESLLFELVHDGELGGGEWSAVISGLQR